MQHKCGWMKHSQRWKRLPIHLNAFFKKAMKLISMNCMNRLLCVCVRVWLILPAISNEVCFLFTTKGQKGRDGFNGIPADRLSKLETFLCNRQGFTGKVASKSQTKEHYDSRILRVFLLVTQQKRKNKTRNLSHKLQLIKTKGVQIELRSNPEPISCVSIAWSNERVCRTYRPGWIHFSWDHFEVSLLVFFLKPGKGCKEPLKVRHAYDECFPTWGTQHVCRRCAPCSFFLFARFIFIKKSTNGNRGNLGNDTGGGLKTGWANIFCKRLSSHF